MAGREGKLVRVQEKGQITLPADVRRRLGLAKGDLVAVIETEDGVLTSPRQVIATKMLNRLGTLLHEQGIDLDEMIESGRALRGELLKEEYGVDAV